LEVCTKRNKPQANAIVINELDRELSDDVLNDLAIEDQLPEEFGQLSLNAISSQEHTNYIKLKTKIKDKVMLILVDSGSTQSFVSPQFVHSTNPTTVPMQPKKVKLAGEWMITDRMVPQLKCYCQDKSFAIDMVVLDMNPYDAILGFDWLQAHSPMFHLCFSERMLQVCLSGCCICSIWMLRMVAMVFKCFLGVFSSVSEACFNCLQTYVTIVVFGCFKSRSNVTSLLLNFCCIISTGAGRASIRRRGQVFPNRSHRPPFPSCPLVARAVRAPHVARNGWALHGAAGACGGGTAGGWQRERA
jgi:hypothetical protein